MIRIITIAFVAAALASAGIARPAHALTPSQSAALAAKARAEALARMRAQAAAKARADFLVKARADAAAKSKVVVTTMHNIQLEIRRRMEAAQKAARSQAQLKTANVQPPPLKVTSVPHSMPDVKPQVPNRLQAHPVQTLRTAPQHASGPKFHGSTSRATAHSSKSTQAR